MGKAHMGKMRNACRILTGKPEGKSTLGRARCRWEDIITMDLKEIRCEGVDCIHLAQGRDQWQVL
jgi:hypothetical protein